MRKSTNLGFRPGPTQTGLYSHRRWLEAGNFGFKVTVEELYYLCSENKGAVTATLISAFVLAYADCWFSDAVAQIIYSMCRPR